jgi:hypothetical protein
MDWKPLVEKRDVSNGVIEYRIEQDDSNNTMLGPECTMTITIDDVGGLVCQVGRSWKDTRARLRRLATKIDEDWTTEGIALSIQKILDCEDTDNVPDDEFKKYLTSREKEQNYFCSDSGHFPDWVRLEIAFAYRAGYTGTPIADRTLTQRTYEVKDAFRDKWKYDWEAYLADATGVYSADKSDCQMKKKLEK